MCSVFDRIIHIYIYGNEAITFPVRSTAFQKKKRGENGCPRRGMSRHSNLPPWSSRQVKCYALRARFEHITATTCTETDDDPVHVCFSCSARLKVHVLQATLYYTTASRADQIRSDRRTGSWFRFLRPGWVWDVLCRDQIKETGARGRVRYEQGYIYICSCPDVIMTIGLALKHSLFLPVVYCSGGGGVLIL